MSPAPSPLSVWESFYVIVGSSAAALTGLQFVVVVLSAESKQATSGSITSAYATPTVLHFCAALLISALVSAPWDGLLAPGILVVISGVAGVAITLLATRHARRQTAYKPVLEDWIFHTALPLVAYLVLIASGATLSAEPGRALFAIGAASLLLLFVGIHNAWDAVTYVALRRSKRPDAEPG